MPSGTTLDPGLRSEDQGVYGEGQGATISPRESVATFGTYNRPQAGKGGENLGPGPSALATALQRQKAPTVAPVRGFNAALNGIFSGATSFNAGERFITAKASGSEVEDTVARLRDLFEITDQGAVEQLLGELLVWFGDNSTSNQTPHRIPFSFGNKTLQMQEVIRCFRPDPRRFWRSLADVTRNFLALHPDVFFHWGEIHGFPPEYRIYAFDTADFCSEIPADARRAVQAAKDASLNRSAYNMMRADLKAVGSGAGTVIEQQAGETFKRRSV